MTADDAGDPQTVHGRHWQTRRVTHPGFEDRNGVFFAAVEMTRMPMIITDPRQADNPIAFANNAFLELTGYRSEEVLGRNCRFLQGANTDRESVAEMREAVQTERPLSIEVINYKRDGSPFWNAVFIGPIYDSDGKLLYFFASQLDVTRRRASEQSYRQAQKMEAIGQLTAGLAHDFNNLLQVVSGNLEAIGRKVEDERVNRYLTNASTAAERGAKLTRQLLAFARKTRLEPKTVDLSALIEDFEDMLHGAVGRACQIDVELAEGLPSVEVDPVHLEMALLNVLINARDAMPGGGRVRIATAVSGRGRERLVTLSVTDEGSGMSPDVLERATEPFFTTKGVGKGTGLGLAMVQGFVQQSRGRLDIQSQPGQGATVRMSFPAAEALAQEPASRPAAAGDAELRGAGERILLVEDEPQVLALAQEILEGLGYAVVSASNGEEALDVFEASDGIDLLFTDLVMPGGMNGLVLADTLRARAPDLPILMTTGYNEELVADGPRPTAMDVLGKPYRRAELADRVRSALARRGRTDAPRGPTSSFGHAEG